MKLVELLNNLNKSEPVFINGVKGRVKEIGDELLTLESIRKEKRWSGKGKDRREDTVLKREITYIPIAQIYSVSEGEKEIPKSQKELEIEKELESI